MPQSSYARSRAARIDQAGQRFREFTGMEPDKMTVVDAPENDAFMAVGKMDGVLYTTVRDGKREHYIHKFKNKSRPLLAASHDGTELRILGGRFRFTDKGIEDR